MIKLSNDYHDNITYKVKYTNIPDGKTILNTSDSVITLRLYARGFRLFSLKYLTSRPVVRIDLQNTKLHKSRYTYSSYILTEPLVQKINKDLRLENAIESIFPDTLSFVLENIISKKVPVIPKVSLTFAKQYQQYGNLQLKPDSVIIRGMPSSIDTIHKVFTMEKELLELNKSSSLSLDIIRPIKSKSFSISSDTVNIFIPVEKFTEASIEVPIKLANEEVTKIKLFPEKVNIKYLVALKDFDKINQEMFDAVADINQAQINSRTLNVKLERHPSFIRIKQVTPSKVEFIILKQ